MTFKQVLVKNPFIPNFLKLFFAVLLLGGCQPAPEKRTYHEIIQPVQQMAQSVVPTTPTSGELDMSSIPGDDIHAAVRKAQGMPVPMPMTGAMDKETQKMLEASVARMPLSWKTPEGWMETPGGGGMRLVSFNSADQDNPVECGIISLGGRAGGVQSNVARWMNQVNIAVPDKAQFEEFLASQKRINTQDGFVAMVVDLTQLQSQEDLNVPSMIAAIIDLPDTTAFVKMTGSRGILLKNKEKFESLCESLKLN